MQSVFSFTQVFFKRAGLCAGIALLAAFFAFMPLSVSAEASIGPSGVSLNPTGAQHPGTSYIVSGSARNSSSDDYTGTVFYMWYYSTNGGGSWSDWSGLQYFTGLDAKKSYNLSRSGTVGPPDGNTYAFRLCVNTSPYVGGGCSSAGSITPTARVQLYTLSVGRSGLGTITGSGISCGSDCSETYTQGTSVSLSASPDSGNGYAFKNWSGDCSGSSCSPTMNANKSVTANFIKVYSIFASASAGGSVSCPSCGSQVPSGTEVKATAAANAGYEFSSWSGGPCGGNTSPICSFTAGSSQSMTANFTRIAYTLSTSVSSGSGTVTGGGSYNSGSSATVRAAPSDNNYEFAGWGGTYAGRPNPFTLTMDSDKSVSASFSQRVTAAPRITRATSQCTLSGKLSYHTANTIAWNAADYPSGTTFRIYIAQGETGSVNDFLTSVTFSSFTQQLRTLQYTANVRPPFPNSSYNGSIDDLSYKVSAVVNGIESGKSNYAYLTGTEDANQCAARFENEPPLPPKQPTRETIYPKAETGPCETPGTIKLSWTKADATKWSGYLIYRFPNDPLLDPSVYQTITIRDINQTSYIDTTPKQNTRYWYRIETLTSTDLGARSGANNLAAVLLAQASVSRGFTGSSVFGSAGGSDTTSAVSSAPCPLPNLTANAPALSDEWGNSGSPLGKGLLTITGAVKNSGSANAPASFKNQYRHRWLGGTFAPFKDGSDSILSFDLLQPTVELVKDTIRAVSSHKWQAPVGTYEFQLVADTGGAVTESNEGDNESPATTVEIVDFTPTLTPNRATAFAGDTITFTASAVQHGNLTNPAPVVFSAPQCGAGGTASVITKLSDTTASFTCKYDSAGVKTATVSATYYKIPKSATAEVSIALLAPKLTVKSDRGACGGNIKLWWDAVPNATSYTVQRHGIQVKPSLTHKTQASPFTDSGLTPSRTYDYTVVAYFGTTAGPTGSKSQTASPACRLKPTVKLFISGPEGECGTAKSATIVKGSKAILCWTVTTIPVE